MAESLQKEIPDEGQTDVAPLQQLLDWLGLCLLGAGNEPCLSMVMDAGSPEPKKETANLKGEVWL